jgi:hypothetical protein
MSQHDNPYASPVTSASSVATEPSRRGSQYLRFSFAYLLVDISIAIPLGILGLVTLVRANTWLERFGSLAFLILPATLGTTAFIALVCRKKVALKLAVAAGACAAFAAVLNGVMAVWFLVTDPGTTYHPYHLVFPAIVMLRACWNVGFIYAARSFNNK